MNSKIAAAVMASALLVCAVGQAQYGRENRYEPRSVNGMIDRVHEDLNRSYEGFRWSRGDRDRLDKAEHRLRDFATQWNRGRFNKGELDESIASIQHVVDNNRMPPRDRERLINDLGGLRGMREAYDRHEIGYGRR